MATVHIDFENKKILIHSKPRCKCETFEISPEDCVINLDRANTAELGKLGTGEIGPNNKVIWLKMNFSDPFFEHAIVEYARELLSPDHEVFHRTRSIGWCH